MSASLKLVFDREAFREIVEKRSPEHHGSVWLVDAIAIIHKLASQYSAVARRQSSPALLGSTYWGWCFVSVLFVNEAARGKGIGGRLLAEAEALASARGAHHVSLDTFSFQAEPFYAQRGYVVSGRLDDFPSGHGRAWMCKPLRRPH